MGGQIQGIGTGDISDVDSPGVFSDMATRSGRSRLAILLDWFSAWWKEAWVWRAVWFTTICWITPPASSTGIVQAIQLEEWK